MFYMEICTSIGTIRKIKKKYIYKKTWKEEEKKNKAMLVKSVLGNRAKKEKNLQKNVYFTLNTYTTTMRSIM